MNDPKPGRAVISNACETGDRRISLGLAAALLVLVLPFLGICLIGGSSEAREAHVMQVIVSQNEWVLPLRNGLVPSKPPLHHWIGALFSFALGKTDEFSARLPSAILGAAILALVILQTISICRRLGDSEDRCRSAGLASAFVLTMTYGFTCLLIDSRVDVTCAFFMTAAVLLVLQSSLACISHRSEIAGVKSMDGLANLDERRDSEPTACRGATGSPTGVGDFEKGLDGSSQTHHLTRVQRAGEICSLDFQDGHTPADLLGASKPTLFFALCALGVLAKGPLGTVFPIWILISASLAQGSTLALLRSLFRPRVGWLVFAALALPWYFLAAGRGGQAFINRQLIFENLLRFIGSEGLNVKPWWFYVPSFGWQAFPWCALILFLLAREVRMLGALHGVPADSDPLKQKRTYLYAFVGGFLFFSIAAGKRHSYLFPLFPYMAIYFALYWRDLPKEMTEAILRRLTAAGSAICVAMIAALAVIKAALITGRLDSYPIWNSAALWINEYWLRYLLVLCVLLAIRKRAFFQVFDGAWLCWVGLLLVGTTAAIGVKAHMKGFDQMANEVNRVAAGRPIQVVRIRLDEYFDPVFFYLRRPVGITAPLPEDIQCEGAGEPLYLAKRDFYDSFSSYASRSGLVVTPLAFLYERRDKLLANGKFKAVLFSCVSGGNSEASSSKP